MHVNQRAGALLSHHQSTQYEELTFKRFDNYIHLAIQNIIPTIKYKKNTRKTSSFWSYVFFIFFITFSFLKNLDCLIWPQQFICILLIKFTISGQIRCIEVNVLNPAIFNNTNIGFLKKSNDSRLPIIKYVLNQKKVFKKLKIYIVLI